MRAWSKIAGTMLVLAMTPGVAAASPTCAETLPVSNHGQHIVGDYVTGIGHEDLGWPPTGQVGATVAANGGAAVPGGPGPGYHFEEEIALAPGASFCTDSNSPGNHL